MTSAPGRAPGWWTEPQLRSLLGCRVVLDDLSGPSRGTSAGPHLWRCHYVLGSRSSLSAALTRHGSHALAHASMPAHTRQAGMVDAHGADVLFVEGSSERAGPRQGHLLALAGRDLITLGLDIVDADAVGVIPEGATTTSLLLDLFRLIRL